MLIGLNGRKQAGKDTVYARACHLLRDVVEVERVSFADLLYESAAASLGVSVEQLKAWKSDDDVRVRVVRLLPETYDLHEVTRVDITVRQYLQHYGTEAHRDIFGNDFWVSQVAARLNLHEDGGHRIVMVTDVRFENEARAIRAAGGDVVEVIGPQGRATDDAHASEAPLPEELIDAVVTNVTRDDNFRALDAQVSTLLRLHLGGDLPC